MFTLLVNLYYYCKHFGDIVMCYLSQVQYDKCNKQNDLKPCKGSKSKQGLPHLNDIISANMTETRDAEIQHLIGGVLCLDFANTLYGHEAPIHEYLFDYPDLVLWSRHVEILTPQQAGTLLSRWEQVPVESEAVFRQAIQLRESIYRIFASLARDELPQENDIARLHHHWVESQVQSKLIRTEDGFAMGWRNEDALDSMLWRIVGSSIQLLTSGELKRVKQCGGCDWLFFDKSRNRSRRWCSMDACGNRLKMARRYKRSKQ
jgi:predicted RNA-binding Zn ribbon-like protein